MGCAFELMSDSQGAQLQFVQALQLIQNCSTQEKMAMTCQYELGAFILGCSFSAPLLMQSQAFVSNECEHRLPQLMKAWLFWESL